MYEEKVEIVSTIQKQFRKENAKMPPKWDRRRFLQGLGFAVLAVQSLSLTGCASGDPPVDERTRADNLVLQSTPGKFDHTHEVVIPYALLQTPPTEGVTLSSTKALFHRHEIVLDQEDLRTVNQEGTVTRKAGSHLFVIALAK